jgi:Amino acid transporters
MMGTTHDNMEKSSFSDEKVQPAPGADFEAYGSDPKGEYELNVGGRAALQRRLRNYQVTMIGFCSGIGTGLFVGTGAAYAKAGPAGLLLAYIIVGGVLWCVMQSIAELATLFPTAGSFPHWATRFIDPSVGFSLAYFLRILLHNRYRLGSFGGRRYCVILDGYHACCGDHRWIGTHFGYQFDECAILW